MKAIIAFEDGRVFTGRSFGSSGEKVGEIVFNTSLSGYQEVLTDPSYKGQIVTMTYPLIGNYGINREDGESRRIFLEGFVVREASVIASNWRSEKSLAQYLKENKIIAVEGVDTRAITRHIREKGAMKAVISTKDLDQKRLVQKAKAGPGLVGRDLVKEVTVTEPFFWHKTGAFKVVVLDCGVKYNTLRLLAAHNCSVKVVPATTSAEAILAEKPNGIMLSNGPGDPQGVPYVIDTVRKLLGRVPIFGICLGQQILGLALGGKTYKLKFGHHGGNHPVKDLKTGRIYITVQNHGFNVDIDSLPKGDIEITHMNLNDNTLEGIRHKKMSAAAVQFHPEASPGPSDATENLFSAFIRMMEAFRA
ncbi:MAG: glutamine-hydrolyzing carbamoyl-phosphate synthase small subunit [Candidatus Omnitrophota bacterium]